MDTGSSLVYMDRKQNSANLPELQPNSSIQVLELSATQCQKDMNITIHSVNSSSTNTPAMSLYLAEVSDCSASNTPADGSLSPTTDAFWGSVVTPLYENLLSTAKYPREVHDQYTTFLNNFILPALGPRPTSSSTWTPHLTKEHSPFEPSWNIQGDKQQIRFTIEPVGPEAGTTSDVLNQAHPLSFVESLAASRQCPSLDTTWWKHFTSELFVSSPEITSLQAISPPARVTPTCFLAFDLPSEEFGPILKAYLFPHRRSLMTAKSTTQCIIDSTKKLHSPKISLLPALSHIESFLNAKHSTTEQVSDSKVISNLGGEEHGKSIEMMAIDCINPSKARIKLYVKENIASFENVKNIYTLGGRRSSAEIDEGLKAFEKFWVALFDDTENMKLKPAFLFLGLEIVPGVEMPEVKLYIPAWTCPFGDGEITSRLAGYFKSEDWAIGSTYDDGFQRISGTSEGASAKASYTYLSFAYSSTKGPYVTLYCSPNLSSIGPI
ncbi:aromatic prenyltransferase [Cadophora sp. DSE1049]|nr:aromatic prenyltransferase [Cadophora sp. DSE1049]